MPNANDLYPENDLYPPVPTCTRPLPGTGQIDDLTSTRKGNSVGDANPRVQVGSPALVDVETSSTSTPVLDYLIRRHAKVCLYTNKDHTTDVAIQIDGGYGNPNDAAHAATDLIDELAVAILTEKKRAAAETKTNEPQTFAAPQRTQEPRRWRIWRRRAGGSYPWLTQRSDAPGCGVVGFHTWRAAIAFADRQARS